VQVAEYIDKKGSISNTFHCTPILRESQFGWLHACLTIQSLFEVCRICTNLQGHRPLGLAMTCQHRLLRAGCRVPRQEREYLKYVPLYTYFERETILRLASRLVHSILDNTIIWGMHNTYPSKYQYTRTPSVQSLRTTWYCSRLEVASR